MGGCVIKLLILMIYPATEQYTDLAYNALENGLTVKKKEKLYIFTKNHEGKKEVYLDSYLRRFMVTNLTIESFKS